MVPDEYDMMGQIRSSFKYFCPNPNCIDMVCPAHQTRNVVPPLQYSNKLSQNDLLNRMESHGGKKQSCKRTCFSSNPLLDADGIAWDETATDELRVVLGMDADALPCDLAVMIRKPCAECFALRPLFLSKVDEKAKKKGQSKQTPRFKDTEPPEEWTPNDPCTHEGDCMESNCECYKNDAHCGRNCHCSKRCKRRWRGCTCSKSKRRNLCRTNDCPCWRAHRECDPELCTRCGAKYLFDDECKNIAIQQNHIKRTELRSATYGLGLFLAADETALEGDYIMEYVGELVYDETAESRQDVAKYLGRNYFYRLNETLNIDASRVGNEARFINHAPSRLANCNAEVLLVNGEHRIGIFAARYIESNEELFLDYGPGFFIHDSDDESQNRVHDDPDTIKGED
ncbi:SET domain-containing protein [Stereum hirsutum FP-91666 SS1]|uniref:SET domain-containing protein n=1 Tax=Stereum hirsutum (strain FP-91666) TaxID=721885 RepID=UPI000444A303|nr:SET domain-containing protein [Stereum hirsutum FP-91666 SS1]EIM81875.1 SET domain-containing protein [Stereum hirsutum FP-91666 SS1]